jgi:Mg-chelatase subunit ChlD
MICNWKKALLIGTAALTLAACESTDTSPTTNGEIISETNAPDSAPPPPPPLPAPVASSESAVLGAKGSRSLGRTSDIVTSSKTSKPAPPDADPYPQAGQLTAADYDDVLNPELYQAYLSKTLQGSLGKKDLPFVDAKKRVTIKVSDRLGKPMPFASVDVMDADGNMMFPQRTSANGTVYLYPAFDAISAGTTVSIKSDAQDRGRTLTLTDQHIKNGTTIELKLSNDAAKVTKLDLLLTLDATGSMSDEMNFLKAELTGIMDRVRQGSPGLDIHVGLIVYRDTGDSYVIREFPFTNNIDAFKESLSAQSAQGGGDMPEAMQDAMTAGLKFDWRDDAVKVNMLVADAPPHDTDITETWDSALYSRSRGIHIVPLAASGIDPTAEFLMRAMGQITGGRYLFLTDDSGIGNPHAEPTVDCYVVTRLDGLVERVLKSLVTGTRVEPDGDNVIRTVGDYRAGVCKVEDAK